ncbi:DMT family transporter [Patescibacteria group bacterium]|nr:DMT family transporter [Patescibacteria group bacterium]
MNKKTAPKIKNIAIVLVVISAFLNTTMGIWVRILGSHFANFQQICARSLMGGLLGLIVYTVVRKLKYKDFLKMTGKDAFFILIRTLSLVVGIGLYTYAIRAGNFSNVNMIYALPTTAILGVFILKEKLTLMKSLAIVFGFIGIMLISVKSLGSVTVFGFGELAALASTFFYSYNYITRKFISKAVNNEEIAVIGALLLGIIAFAISVFSGNNINNFFTIDWTIALTILAAGVTFILIGVLNNYGFQYLEAITANNLFTLESLFGLLIGVSLYREPPTPVSLVGGILVVSSALLANYSEKYEIENEMDL